MRAIERLLRSRRLPATCGAFAFGLVLFVWGSLAKVPVGNDESAICYRRVFSLRDGSSLPRVRFRYSSSSITCSSSRYWRRSIHRVTRCCSPPENGSDFRAWIPALLVAFTAAILCLVDPEADKRRHGGSRRDTRRHI